MRYMAPEVLHPGSSGGELSATDIWSFGLVVIELASGKQPADDTQRTDARVQALLDSIPTGFTSGFRDVVRAMLQLEPRLRPSAAELLSRPLFAAYAVAAEPFAPSADVLRRAVDSAKWAVREQGLQWQRIGGGDVKMCDCGSGEQSAARSTPEQRAARQLLDLIRAAPGNESFESTYLVDKVVVASSRSLATGFLGQATSLNSRYAGGPAQVFSLRGFDTKRPDGSSYHTVDAVDETSVPRPMSRGTPDEQAAREETLQYFMDMLPSLMPELDRAKVWLAFQATSSEMVAQAILHGQFAKLSTVDPGYYGKGAASQHSAEQR